jgi:hypothetical protein
MDIPRTEAGTGVVKSIVVVAALKKKLPTEFVVAELPPTDTTDPGGLNVPAAENAVVAEPPGRWQIKQSLPGAMSGPSEDVSRHRPMMQAWVAVHAVPASVPLHVPLAPQ